MIKSTQLLTTVAGLYYHLVLVVGPAGSGKTAALRAFADALDGAYINVNLHLSRSMLELTGRQRALQVSKLLDDVIGSSGSLVLLDNIELLFDPALRQDPLRLFQSLSRRRTVVVAWNGQVEGDYLTYAEPDHPEYRRFAAAELLTVSPSQFTREITQSKSTGQESH